MLFDYFNNTRFESPYFLWLGLAIPLLAVLYILRLKNHSAAVKVSSVKVFLATRSWKTALVQLPFVLRMLALAFLVVALARPQAVNQEQHAEGEGVDIILCIDVSGSMTAQDFTPNRMEAAKKVAADFIDRRLTDRIGIVIFSGESFTQCPLTTDKPVLKAAVEHIHNGLLEDGTAIGDGLATSVDRLRNSQSKTKLVILLTDGENNGGLIGPANAKEIAKTFGIKVYTIGVGTDGYAPFPVKTPAGVVVQQQKVTIDEKLLTAISSETGGKYFRAKDNTGLENIYTEIDAMEKSKVDITSFTRYTDKYFPVLMAALFFILLEVVLKFTVFKKFP
ncbi:MAG TPA: VWA domain-containing protein [Ferruginibacter sp.]|nr:VWA domain-containing protein [Ferruginibacter sp.]HMP19383.1 VWA domain-containing protein [Ferruginibacter sp.]